MINCRRFKEKSFIADRNQLAESLLQNFGLEEFTTKAKKTISKTQNLES